MNNLFIDRSLGVSLFSFHPYNLSPKLNVADFVLFFDLLNVTRLKLNMKGMIYSFIQIVTEGIN